MTTRHSPASYRASTDYVTLGGLRDALSELDQSAAVYIDNRQPTALSSYRGYYEQLAIERTSHVNPETSIDKPGDPFDLNMAGYGTYTPRSAEVRIKSPATVGEVIKALNLADGATFEGYKGGQYAMDADTGIWVSEYGDVDSLRIERVETLPGRVDLFTTEVEW